MLNSRWVQAQAQRMLRCLGLPTAELSVLLTDDRAIQKLNGAFRGKDRPTDVLAFPLDGESYKTQGDRHIGHIHLLGDIVISLDTANRQAKARRQALGEEVRRLLAHGLLHLLGYDHRTRAEQREMRQMTRRLVGASRA